MSLLAPHNTLAYQLKGRPLCLHRDMGHVPLAATAKSLQAFMSADNDSGRKPEKDALWFYFLNHVVARVRQDYDMFEPLPPTPLAILDKYHETTASKACRAFYYLLLITLRESRHLHNKSEMVAKLKTEHGQEAVSMIGCMSDNSSGAGATFHSRAAETGVKAGPFAKAIRDQFYQGSYSGGYGGKAWGKVADCMASFVTGEYSAEMMMDTVWTLCHNNGPIFNKGMLYGMYDGVRIKRILDVQRSGQIPQMLAHDSDINQFVDYDLKALVASYSKLFPELFGEYVDWFKVEALGSVGKYPGDKEKQAQKWGVPEGFSYETKSKAKPTKSWDDDDDDAIVEAKPSVKKFKVTPDTEVAIGHSPSRVAVAA